MGEPGERFWLLGNPSWWGIEGGALPPSLRKGELPLPSEWGDAESTRGRWQRQRLRPIAWGLLKPFAWAPFFLIACSFPLAFPGKTPDDQTVALTLFLISWSLLVIPLLMERNSQPSSGGTILSLPIDWKLLAAGTVVFPLHVELDPRLGWISYSFFVISMIRSFSMMSESFAIPPARFVAPVNRGELGGMEIDSQWTILSERWIRGPMAILATDNGSLMISGGSRAGHDFVCLAYRHHTGFVQDCFFEGHPESEALADALAKPPIQLNNVEWPSVFTLPCEEE
ncbi:MAG: hypothetical protein QGI73_00070 [Candidatus Thalassarchaeaceae archaeon]|nr:hypothetical protein [Candidatus Thalassarchaeaceae archaeon]